MRTGALRYSFGPVPSRRLGQSLGINNIPAKVCSYSCVYCQVGRTTRQQIDRRDFYAPDDLISDVRRRLKSAARAAERVDYLAFVPDGEPTLDVNLGEAILRAKEFDVRIGVITNGSLLQREDVRKSLRRADWVSLKVDAVEEGLWRRIDRPHKALRLAACLDGALAFARTFAGELVTETMLVRGLNDHPDRIAEVAEFLRDLRPGKAYLSVPTRPPAENWVQIPDEEALNRAYHIFAERMPRVEYLVGDEGNAFAYTGEVEKDLLSITAVHPMRKEAVDAFLTRAGASWQVVERLLGQGTLAETKYAGSLFYIKRFEPDREARL